MHFPDEEKSDRKEALMKIMDMMKGRKVDRLKSMKKNPDLEIEAVSVEPMEGDEGFEEDSMESEAEPSDEEKAMIAKLYHKYCE